MSKQTGSAIKSMCLKLECGLFTTFGYAVYYAALSIHILYLYLLYHSRSSVYVFYGYTVCVFSPFIESCHFKKEPCGYKRRNKVQFD